MTNETLAQLLIVILLLITNIRFIFIKNVKADSLCTLPFLALIISILTIISLGTGPLIIFITVLSFFCSVWNFRSLLRFTSKLVIDHYGIMFKIISIINLLISIFALFLVIAFRPMKYNAKKLMATEEKIILEGNFEKGFNNSQAFFKKSFCEIIKVTSSRKEDTFVKYSPHNPIEYYEAPAQPEKIVLFIPPKTASIKDYAGFAHKLAYDGCTVYMAHFYADDMKWLKGFKNQKFNRSESFRILKFKNPQNYETIIKSSRNRFLKEMEALYKIVSPSPESEVYLVTEEDLSDALKEFMRRNPAAIKGAYDLAYTEGYPTAGYGPVENCDPAFAYFLNLKPERLGYMSNHIALSLEKAITATSAIYIE